MAKEIPVYLFVGFLESGKTKFIQETFEDPNFDSGDKTLLLICEEGEEEYNPKKFAFPGVTVKVLEDKAELNPQNLLKLEKESGAGRVVIEYNGMWLLQDLAEALPESWICLLYTSYHTYKELCIQLGVYDKFRLRLHGIYLSLFESPLPNGPVQKLSDAFARTHSRI